MNAAEQKLYNITLALAGIFQVAALVRELATTGAMNSAAFQVSIESLYKIEAKDVPEVFGGEQGVKMGLTELVKLLGNEKVKIDPNTSRYVVNLFHLEKRLKQDQPMQKTISRRLQYAISQATHFSTTHETVINTLAETYLQTLGRLPFRIQIIGQAKFLNQSEVLNKVRALLLAGVRAAMLWRQVGGTRWQIFLWRSKLAGMAKQILGRL